MSNARVQKTAFPANGGHSAGLAFPGLAFTPDENSHGNFRRYFQIAGITVSVESGLDFNEVKFKKEFIPFAVDGPGSDNVTLRHYFQLPDLRGEDLGKELYRRRQWSISRKNGAWIYRGVTSGSPDSGLHRVAVFNSDYTRSIIYSTPAHERYVRAEGFHSLSLLPSDQIWLVPLLADRNAVLLHSAAVIVNGRGLLFAGHSGAGKSTTVTMLASRAEILCDDRNVARLWKGGWRVHGTWSHGDVPDVSPSSAPLRAVLFLQQHSSNELVALTDRKLIWRLMLGTLIKPMASTKWWQKELSVLERLVRDVPCYIMRFDQSGNIVAQLEKLAA